MVAASGIGLACWLALFVGLAQFVLAFVWLALVQPVLKCLCVRMVWIYGL